MEERRTLGQSFIFREWKQSARCLARINKGIGVVDVVNLDFSRLRLFQWFPAIGQEATGWVSAVIFF